MKRLISVLIFLLVLTSAHGAGFCNHPGFCGKGATGGGGTSTIFTPSASPLNADDNNATVSFRIVGTVTGATGTKLRATIAANSTVALNATHVSACKWDGGVDSNCTTAPVELTTAGGSSGFAIAAAGTITTDFVTTSGTFALSPGDSVIIIVDVSTNGGQRFRAGQTNTTTWFSNPGQVSWNVQTPGVGLGFTAINNTDYMITSVETQ